METGRTRAGAHLRDIDLRRYRARQMEPEELLAANDHLAVCAECYDDFGGEDVLESAYRFASSEMADAGRQASEHLPYGRLISYVDGQMSEESRSEAADHLATCAQCREDVHELMQLSKELKSIGEVSPVEQNTRRQSGLFRSPAAVRLAFEIAAVTIAFVAGGWLLSTNLRGRVDRLTRESIELRRTNEELRTESARKAMLDGIGIHGTATPEKSGGTIPLAASSPQTVAALKDDKTLVTLNARGKVEGYDSLPSRYLAMIREALKTGNVATTSPFPVSTATLRGPAGQVDKSAPFRLLGPVATSVREIQPTFRWEALSGATSYSIAIFGTNYQELLSAKDLRATEWRPPKTLARGATYLWQVTAFKDGKEIVSPGPANVEARFKVLGNSQVMEIERAQQRWGDSNLLLGLLYARAGLHEEAAQKFQALLEANPDSPVADRLSRKFRER